MIPEQGNATKTQKDIIMGICKKNKIVNVNLSKL
jgi:hypothetical protein